MQWREMHGTWPGSSCPDISLKLPTSSGTVTALWGSVVMLPLPCSLGISMLEIACDLELPSGGPNWHHLRDGHLPQEFTKGTVMDPLLISFPAPLPPSPDLSPQLMQLLAHMMHPQPGQRPTASEVLQHWTLRRAVWRGQSRKAAYRMVRVYTPLCVVFSSCLFSFAVVFSPVGVVATVQSIAAAAGPSAGVEGTGGEVDMQLLTSTFHWSCR